MQIIDVLDYELYGRTFIVTLYSLCLFRVSSSRLLGQYSPIDLIMVIVIGAVLGSAIVGGLPLLSSLISAGLIVATHRGLIIIASKYTWAEEFIIGSKALVIRNGSFLEKNLDKSKLSSNDILQALRAQQGEDNIQNVRRSYVETNGSISFIMK